MQRFKKFKWNFLWQVQSFVKFKCVFPWQAWCSWNLVLFCWQAWKLKFLTIKKSQNLPKPAGRLSPPCKSNTSTSMPCHLQTDIKQKMSSCEGLHSLGEKDVNIQLRYEFVSKNFFWWIQFEICAYPHHGAQFKQKGVQVQKMNKLPMSPRPEEPFVFPVKTIEASAWRHLVNDSKSSWAQKSSMRSLLPLSDLWLRPSVSRPFHSFCFVFFQITAMVPSCGFSLNVFFSRRQKNR